MKLAFTTILLIISITLFSQNKIYLDENWEETTQDKAHFYRVLEKKSDNLYYIEDYYINGNLQMDGYFSNLDNETLEGEINWYDTNGRLTTKKHYKNGKEEGLAIGYLPNGEILAQGNYKDGEPVSGLFSDSCSCSFSEYKDGVRIKDVSFYQDSKQVAHERFYKQDASYGEYPEKDVFYDKNGANIGVLSYSEKDFYTADNGVSYEFYRENDRCAGIRYKKEIADGKTIKKTMYDKAGKVIYEGVYKDDEPFDGDFIDSDSVFFTVTNMKKGVIQYKITFNNEDKSLLYKLIYKDGVAYEGQEKNYRELSTYKNGKRTAFDEYYDYDFKKIKNVTVFSEQGSKTIIYNEAGEQIGESFTDKEGLKNGLELDGNTRTQYKNNEVVWVEKEDFTGGNQMLHCDYKDGEPFDGVFLNYQDKHYYKNGNKVKIEYFRLNYDTEKYYLDKLEIYKDNQIVAQTQFVDDRAYTIKLKDNNYYEGELYDLWRGEYFTYKNGNKEGYYAKFKDRILIEEGQYTADKKEGTITYYPNNPDKETTCTFKEGKPFNGIVSNQFEKTSYKNGKKHGECIAYDTNSTTISNYVNGIKEGKETTTWGDKTYTGYYKNGEAFTGDFFDIYDSPYGRIISYHNGEKQGEFITINNSKITQRMFFNEGVRHSEKTVFTADDKLLGKGYYRYDKPYMGTFIKHLELDNYSITKYKKGEIVEEVISTIKIPIDYARADTEKPKATSIIIEKYTYKNGLKEGEYISTNEEELPHFRKIITGVYKKGKPYSGEFMANTEDFKVLSTYKKGLKNGVEYYETYKTDSLFYKKGIIDHGKQIETADYYFFTHYYKNSQKTKSEIDDYIITYQDRGFTVLKDNLEAQLVFSNKEKNEGTITYFEEKTNIGTLQFSGDTILNAAIHFKHLRKEFKDVIINIKNNKVGLLLKPDEKFKIYYQISSSSKTPKALSYRNYDLIKEAFAFPNQSDFSIKQFSFDDTLLAEMKMKDKKTAGIFIMYNEKDDNIFYKIRLEGKEERIIRGLSYDELLEELKKFQKNNE